MGWLSIDYTDFYIEEEQIYNPCGELIKTVYYIRYADYNIFGRKKYVRYFETVYCGGYELDTFINVLCWKTKEEALEFWKKQEHYTKSIIHKSNCNE